MYIYLLKHYKLSKIDSVCIYNSPLGDSKSNSSIFPSIKILVSKDLDLIFRITFVLCRHTENKTCLV